MRRLFFLSFILFLDILSATEVSKKIELNERQKEIFEKLEDNKNKDIIFHNVKKPKNLKTKKKLPCKVIYSIKDDTITLISNKYKKEIYQKYIGKCNTIVDLKNLTNELTSIYIEKGYITSKVYLKSSSISDGVLKLFAIEGKIDKILPDELYVKNAFLFQKNRFLNLRSLEDSLEVINRLPSNKAKLKLAPSKKVGYSNVIVENSVEKKWHGYLGVNNFGDKKTGRVQGNLSLGVDDIIGLNDQFKVNLNSTDKHFKDENSVGDSFSYSFAIGHVVNTFSLKETSYEQLISGGLAKYKTDGKTKTYEYSLKYRLFHNLNNSFDLGTTISHSKSKNYIEDTLIETSSYELSDLSFNIDYLYRDVGFYMFVVLDYKQGVDWFSINNPTNLNEKYSLYNITLILDKKFKWLDYNLNLYYQHSNDQLFARNQISIGGAYSVRGYQDEGLSGNNGYYFRNEFSKELQSKLFGKFTQRYFLGVDGGWIKKEEDSNGGSLLSGIVGVKLFAGKFGATLYYADPFYKEDVEKTSTFVGFLMNYSF